jgi:uncharacterized membrane protein (GlpM family)
MRTLWLKLAITPFLMTGATLAIRLWGPTAGGWIVGLPLTSGPISLLLFLERGPQFAAHAAISTLLGINGVTSCVVVYAHCARRWAWPATTAASLLAFVVTTLILRTISPSPVQSFLGAAAYCILGLALLPRGGSVGSGTVSRWDLPARIGLSLLMVLTITALAERLGPVLSGMLSTFPMFTLITAAFSHRELGGGSATLYGRGLLSSLIGFSAFFLVVALLLERMGLTAFVFAAVASLLVGATSAAITGRLWANRE